ncbi:MAG: hypothetical protein GXP35_08700, partial [Actinobacteria bacterium]|nr:hypothetical protein [Actinomycetota bacterium]
MLINVLAILFGIGWALLTAVLAARRGPKPVSLSTVFVTGAIVGFGAGLVALVIAIPRDGMFAAVHIAYVAATLGPAVLAVIGVAAMRTAHVSRSVPSAVFIGLMFVPGAIGLWATHVAPFRLQVERVTADLPCQRGGDDSIVIGVLADIQTPTITDYERDALQRVMDANPDLIVIAGDIQQSSDFYGELDTFREFFALAQAPFGVYVVQGDVESLGDMRELVAGTGVTYLENEIVEIAIGDRLVRLGGNQRAWKLSDPQSMFAELGEAPPEVVTVVLSHRPDVVFDLSGSVDVVIAGHTHGGQV